MTHEELDAILAAHKLWLSGRWGQPANLTRASLAGANLTDANLTDANLTDANLTRASLTRASLTRANLTRASLAGANLTDASLAGASLAGANLTDARLAGANLDFSCWPLWCGSMGVIVDSRIAAQLAAHFCVLTCDDPTYLAAREALLPFARTSHRAADLGLIEEDECSTR